jgi:predicted DNA-binding protein with PD1-like motif
MASYTVKRTIIGQLERGADLHNGISRIVREHRIVAGRVTGIGAVQKAKIAYYDQKQLKYFDIDLPEPMEIVSMYGNVSLKEGMPFVHCHVVLADEKGNGKGGHLLPDGTPVFACEITIEEFEGPELVRSFEAGTGLALWPKERTL